VSESFDFRIGIIGPTRVGKTSLLASLLSEAQTLLEGTPVGFIAQGVTRRRLAQHQTDLRGSLLAGEFTPGGLKGTEEPFKFELAMAVGNTSIQLGFLDYPGGWIDSTRRSEKLEREWEQCESWIQASSVLLIPIDASVLMEATLPKHKRAIPDVLRFHDVEQVVRNWAKVRNQNPKEPALLILVPLKCESYFADNGGRRDKSRELFDQVRQHYNSVLEIARAECPLVHLLYAPIDTFGCVEIMRAEWKPNELSRGGLEFSADYVVRDHGQIRTKGASTVLIALCKHLMEAKAAAERNLVHEQQNLAEQKSTEAQRYRGIVGEVFAFFTGEKRQLRREVGELEASVEQRTAELAHLDRAVENLALRPLGSRAKQL
jgi:hypothetical protein